MNTQINSYGKTRCNVAGAFSTCFNKMNILTKDSPKKLDIKPGDVVAVCAWCCPVEIQNNVALSGGVITHGVCQSCKDDFNRTIERNRAIQNNANKIDFALPKC